jgi:hypothetical protein
MDLSAITDTVVMEDMADMEATAEGTDLWVEPNRYQTKNTLSNWGRSMIQIESFSGNKSSKG